MTISEVSKKYGITTDTLRYYERIGLIPPVPRRKNGIRDYDEKACGWVSLVKCMRSAGVQIEPLIEYVALVQSNKGLERRKDILLEQRAKLLAQAEQLRTTIELLNYKIEHYEELIPKNK
jgi:DNA-binding transcriptional MerR regulator